MLPRKSFWNCTFPHLKYMICGSFRTHLLVWCIITQHDKNYFCIKLFRNLQYSFSKTFYLKLLDVLVNLRKFQQDKTEIWPKIFTVWHLFWPLGVGETTHLRRFMSVLNMQKRVNYNILGMCESMYMQQHNSYEKSWKLV